MIYIQYYIQIQKYICQIFKIPVYAVKITSNTRERLLEPIS